MDTRSGGSGRDAKSAGRRAQSPRFRGGSWLLSSQESAGPVGSQEDVRGDGRTAVFPDVKRAAPGNPSIFCLQVPVGAPESDRPEDTVSRWRWPECQKRTQIRGHHVRALARITAAKRGAGPLSQRGSRSFCDRDSSGSFAEPCWSLNNEGSVYPVCRSHARSSARPQGVFCVQCDMGRTAPESEKEKQIHDIDHM